MVGSQCSNRYGHRAFPSCSVHVDAPPTGRTSLHVVAERDWEPPRPSRFANDQIVALRVACPEVAVRERVKQAGGRWNRDRQVWEMRCDHTVALRSDDRIVDEPASTSGNHG